jgi:uncharacterized protein (TIGR02597 family)
MKNQNITLPTLLLSLLTGFIGAQTPVYTPPVGFVSVTVPANSDAIMGAPLERASVFTGAVASISTNVITLQGTPSWTAGQFVQNSPTQNDTFAIKMGSGSKEGMVLKVTANGTGSLTVAVGSTAADDLSGIVAGDSLDVFPLWTPSTIFSGTIPDNTEFYLYDNTASGENPAPSEPLTYFTGFGWFDTVNYNDQSHRSILPGTGFILRNVQGSPLTLSMVGAVPMSKNRVVIRTLAANTAQDQRITYSSPVPETLNNMNLGAADYDEMYLFDNTTSGINKPPTPLVFASGRWYNSVTFADVTDTTTIQPGSSFIYRKAATATPSAFVWSDLQSYLQ